jgi:predicted TIM-barrel fold metal-dependent hydrolase
MPSDLIRGVDTGFPARSCADREKSEIMDTVPNEVRQLNFNDYSTAKHLEHAAQQARARNYQDFLIVDVDAHHYENESYKEVFEYIESPVIRRDAIDASRRPGRSGMLNSQVGNQGIGGRITRHNLRGFQKVPQTGHHRDVHMTLEWMDAMGVDYACLFPTPMLFLGLHPQVEIEVAMCRAYNRWLCERILAVEPRLISMLYIPFNDPEAAYRTVKDFGDKKGVVGFMVTSPRYKPVHDNAYMKTYALLEEMGKPISFHAAYNWNDQSLSMTNRFISVHALGFIWFNMVHLTNWVVNGLPERFPKLKVMWIESGLTWAYSLMQRLDHSYMMRTSDCPSLKRKPSEYMREMYYSSQPMEKPADLSILEATFKMINAETQLLWSSDYPHWDFDLPGVIYDLPFLDEKTKRNILGGNAARAFGLDTKVVKRIP